MIIQCQYTCTPVANNINIGFKNTMELDRSEEVFYQSISRGIFLIYWYSVCNPRPDGSLKTSIMLNLWQVKIFNQG